MDKPFSSQGHVMGKGTPGLEPKKQLCNTHRLGGVSEQSYKIEKQNPMEDKKN